eukprot:TRINITY_DN372_c0_g1_i3.p1 TRINITY_DN372_c0_g1~~TRINITY_DN372_c0_g1_i3.p1  ORF type:complete len:180 (-),score=34.16 TRINITY_DN372_c0_g1_i3:118-657(-)
MCIRDSPQTADYVVETFDDNNKKVQICFKVRPHAIEMIEKVSQFYEVGIFTAATNYYAKAVVKILDPSGKIINNILARSDCMMTRNGFSIKDLRIIKNRDLKDIIMVDNLVHSFGLQLENGIPILEWTGDKEDQELKYIFDYLVDAYLEQDVREYNKRKLKLREMGFKSWDNIWNTNHE